MDLEPPPGRTPEIWIAAHGPRMLHLTGRYGDGWLPIVGSVTSPEDYRSKLAQIHAAAKDARRDPAAITPALFAYIAVAPTEQRVRALLKSRFLRYFALLIPADRWREVGAEHPFGAQCRGFVDIVPERYDRATLEDAIAAVPPEVIGTGVLVGTPEQVIARPQQFGDAGLRRVVLGPLSAFITVPDVSTQGGRSEGSLAHCGRDSPRPARHQLGRRKAAVPTGVYDNWGSPVEVTTWKQLGE